MTLTRRATPERFVLQMAGHPGSGKSVLAGAIGEATGALVLDKDVVKSALLNVGLSEEQAAGAAYEVLFDLARAIQLQGSSVILDSPAYFPEIRVKGRAIAKKTAARYFILKCVCPDDVELERRLAERPRLASQMSVVRDLDSRPGTTPLTEPHLEVDTTRPLAVQLAQVLDYMRGEPAGIQPLTSNIQPPEP